MSILRSLPEQVDFEAPALAAAGLGQWEIDLSSDSARCSPRAEALLGLAQAPSPRTLSSLLDAFIPEDRSAVAAAFAKVRSTGRLQFERRIRHAIDGTVRWLHVKGGLSEDASAPTKLMGIVADVTEWRSHQDRRHQSESMAAISHVCGRIAHDYNNFLMAVGTNLEMYEEQVTGSERARRFYDAAQDGLQRGARFNESLMSLAGRHHLHLAPVRVDALLLALEPALRTQMEAAINTELLRPSGPLTCTTDASQLEAAIQQLAANAQDAMPGGGTLRLSLNERQLDGCEAAAYGVAPGPFVVIAVDDTGIGIDDDGIAHVIQPFFTTKGARRAKGLGLSQAYMLARRSGGFIDIASRLGQGTSVQIYLPQIV
ncbi:PAS domain-containing protein [Alcaligenaceae bacterium]|nr:PAS domain-containing protein [Alcaligenaceae bacterium]